MWKWLLRGLLPSPLGMATLGDGRPDNSLSDMQGLQNAYAEARAKRLAAQSGSLIGPPAPAMPTPPISTDNSAPSAPAFPWGAGGIMARSGAPTMAPAPAPMPAPGPSMPLPAPRPDAAPQAAPVPDMSFFQRNAAMMRDPGTGSFIDPTAAAQAQSQIRGPDLINKMMSYLHNKVDT